MGHVAYIILLAILLKYFGRIMRAPSGHVIRKSGFLVDKLPSDREFANFASLEFARSHVTAKNINLAGLGII